MGNTLRLGDMFRIEDDDCIFLVMEIWEYLDLYKCLCIDGYNDGQWSLIHIGNRSSVTKLGNVLDKE